MKLQKAISQSPPWARTGQVFTARLVLGPALHRSFIRPACEGGMAIPAMVSFPRRWLASVPISLAKCKSKRKEKAVGARETKNTQQSTD